MSLTEGDRAECREIAREIITEVIKGHVTTCPHGLWIARSKAILIGVCIGGGFTGGGLVYGLFKAIAGST